MYQGLRSDQYQKQAGIPTAHLAQTMHLLTKTNLELEAEIQNELAANPALEMVEDRRCLGCGRPLRGGVCPQCSQRSSATADDLVVYFSPRSSYDAGRFPGRGVADGDDDDDLVMQRIVQPMTLAEHVLRQVGPQLDGAVERKVAAYILNRLDDRGLLPERPPEIAMYLHVPLDTVCRVLGLIQQADPAGIAAQDVREGLLLQVASLEVSGRAHPLARTLIEDHWEALAYHGYDRIAAALAVAVDEIQAAARFIRLNLTPYPARANWQAGGDRTPVQQPDALIYHNPNGGEGLVIEIFSPIAGRLRVAPSFKQALQHLSDDESSTWRQYVERASLLAKCLQQRNHTMRRILTYLVEHQRDFVLDGDSALTPMTRARVARHLGLHESTVSRAIANKAVALPSGRVVPLSKFFDRSLAVRTAIREIVANETRPLSDTEIAHALADQGHAVARRTVAKYRQMLGILPAPMRLSVAFAT